MACLLAVDAGTTGVRTLAFDESGAVRAAAYRPLSTQFPRPGWVEQDPEEIWALVATTLADAARMILGEGETVAAIGLANQRETAIAWDRKTGRPLHSAIVWQDRRTAARCEELTGAGLLPLVRDRTGLVLDPYFSATKFEWLLGDGGVDAGSHLALGTVDAWLLFCLTGGAVFATDVSNASRTMLFDIRARSWTPELCEAFAVPRDALPEVRPSCGRLGTVSSGGAPLGSLGIFPALRGVPISGAAGDQQAALFGQVCDEPGMAKVTYGTGSFLLAHAGTSCPAPREGLLTTVAWDLDGHELREGAGGLAYAFEGSTFVAGAAIQWLRDGLAIIADAAESEALASSLADNEGVYFVPALTGLGSPRFLPEARGSISGLTRGSTRAHLARAALEAIAYQSADVLDAVAAQRGLALAELRVDGGASANRFLMQFQADILGIPVVVAPHAEMTALGAAALAGLGAGLIGEREVSGLLGATQRYEPRMDAPTRARLRAGWARALAGVIAAAGP